MVEEGGMGSAKHEPSDRHEGGNEGGRERREVGRGREEGRWREEATAIAEAGAREN